MVGASCGYPCIDCHFEELKTVFELFHHRGIQSFELQCCIELKLCETLCASVVKTIIFICKRHISIMNQLLSTR